MSRRSDAALALFAGVLFAAGAAGAADTTVKYGFGKPATAVEIRAWDIDVRPDGAGLPPGRGSVGEGQVAYDAKCASCHGTFGESNDYMVLAGGIGTLASDAPIRTTGSKLNYATTLFDYIRRAMPFQAPKTLTDDEVYALTAYVLHLNDLLPADASLDRDSIVRLKLPNRDGFTTAHGLMRRDGRPDVASVACMTNCGSPIRLSSEIPEHARDSHGNLADQTRAQGAVEGIDTSRPAGAGSSGGARPASAPLRTAAAAAPPELAKSLACTTCHAVSARLVGPAFREIAQRYAGDGAAEARLAAKVRDGGGGTWGAIPMPPQPQVKEADARALAAWILGGAR